jgi:glycosyltransferase involved in cell wall biosynthesis
MSELPPLAAPAIGVVIPCFNGARYLEAALLSVLAQEPRVVEIVMIDDGSSDESASIAARHEPWVRCFRQLHAGAGAARNRGVSLLSSPLVAFLDADDLWPAGRLRLLGAALDAHPELDGAFGAVREFLSPELPPELSTRVQPRPPRRAPLPGALLIRRPAFERAGTFPESLTESVGWYMQALDRGVRFAEIDDVVLLRRLHSSNVERHRHVLRGEYARVLKQGLDRRRRATAPSNEEG